VLSEAVLVIVIEPLPHPKHLSEPPITPTPLVIARLVRAIQVLGSGLYLSQLFSGRAIEGLTLQCFELRSRLSRKEYTAKIASGEK
jgi:hypothetical protein